MVVGGVGDVFLWRGVSWWLFGVWFFVLVGVGGLVVVGGRVGGCSGSVCSGDRCDCLSTQGWFVAFSQYSTVDGWSRA